MKSAIAVLAAVFFYAGTSSAAVENVLSMQRETTGTFSVVCDTKGVVTHNLGVTADSIRADGVCAEQVHVALLEEGLYKTNADFCSQTVKWSGEKIQLLLDAPCTGTVVLEKFQEGWYRGKLQGFEYTYELEVKSNSSYVFYSRSFNTQGEFTKSTLGLPTRNKSVKRHIDPSRN